MIRCKIADLIVEVPTTGGMSSRCQEYLYFGKEKTDICILTEKYRTKAWQTQDEDVISYMESGVQFYGELLSYNGLMLHASAVELNGKAYLFSGPCGTGKSTHTRLWQQTFGSAAQVFNDDKPAIRYIDGKWYAYGTPWCGKDGINQNKRIPLAGICFLKQSKENKIHQLTMIVAIQKIISQTRRKFWKVESIELMLRNIEQLVKDIPVFELENLPEVDAALLSYEIMHRKAEELGL